MSKSSLLTLRNVDIFYGRIHAVKRVSMHVNAGEIVALIGGNGAGKTSLLTAISGLVRPASGSVSYEGKDIHKARAERIVRMGVSHVPEGRLVFGPMSVADNLALGGYVRKSKEETRRDIDQIYAMFPVLAERRRQLAGTLSGGEQQMLAIGRALMAKPRLLLLDEPSMGLAPRIARDIFSHVVELKERFGLTVLLVEQNAKNALRIADRGYVLETGRVVLQGPADDLLANRDVQRAYLGRDVAREM
ncbi:ABC transporter ATP-binding protein [Oceanidesulfovibrio marinus]|uniref:ABC transporter ATP-binding protein n=1 Tax=Oceanidesulfovibrio marinus TaxID=370038 RepID=A0A6P1ZLG7_9BACT|nr:ABC transporter ATP-binding protein [Oceanidesulfovibrio marinus]QJT09219.1 ABC transporter ATP-binding protein [Oceanidesulfovibrio marinus]TVM36350.1 branched-chain amino acid ABC transporter ATP-binding protein [Oceanidesulfovibrio marinus]